MKSIIMMYVSLVPSIIAGIVNMIWCKSSLLKKFQTPIDCGKNFIDKKRLLGNNKTWKGMLRIHYIQSNIFYNMGNCMQFIKYKFL